MTHVALRWWRLWERAATPRTEARATTGGGGGDGQEPVCIGMVEGRIRAEIARSFLEDAGFTVWLQGESVAEMYALPGGPLAMVRIMVPAIEAEEAAQVYAEFDDRSYGVVAYDGD